MADNSTVDTLIATLPTQIQQNALRQQQQYANALKIQQELAAQNALRSIYANQGNIDPDTGLPRPAAMGPLVTAAPSMGLDFLQTEGGLASNQARIADAMARARMLNLQAESFPALRNAQIQNLQSEAADRDIIASTRVAEQRRKAQEQQQKTQLYWAKLFDENVAAPAVEYSHRLPMGLPQDTRDQMLATRVDELRQAAIAKYGPPEAIQNRWDLMQFNQNWEPQLGLVQRHLEKMAAQKPRSGTETWTEGGKSKTASYDYDLFGNRVDPTTKAPYVDHGGMFRDAPTGAGAAETSLGAGTTYRVPDPNDPSRTTSKFLFPPKKAGDPWLQSDQTPYTGPVPTSKVNPGDPDSPGSGMSPPAEAYIAERERLGSHVTATWATGKYIPGMAEDDIRSSLGLPDGAPVTKEDARAAALNDMVIQGQIHSGRMALNVIARQNALVQSFEGTAVRNAREIERLGPTATSKGDLLWNRLAVAGRREIQIDPALAALDNAVTDFKNEYVKIMSTSAGQGGMSSDQARSEGDRLFNVKQPWPVMKAALDEARRLMKNRVSSIHADWDATVKAMHGKGAFPEQLDPTSDTGVSSRSGNFGSAADAAKSMLPADGKAYWVSGPSGREKWRKNADGTVEKLQ